MFIDALIIADIIFCMILLREMLFSRSQKPAENEVVNYNCHHGDKLYTAVHFLVRAKVSR